jgi:2-amino-4-hydroxy-6-hydroxymethyldihydropteridine diphosphokinase
LDILVFGDQKISEPGLEIPHPRMSERDFVVIPLVELASKSHTTETPEAVVQLLQVFRKRSPNQSDAVIPVQSDLWRAGPLGTAADADAPRPGAGPHNAQGRG